MLLTFGGCGTIVAHEMGISQGCVTFTNQQEAGLAVKEVVY